MNGATPKDSRLSGRLGYVPFWRSFTRRFPGPDIARAYRLLDRVGLSDHVDKRADALSGGQRQRVGIARALEQEPALLLVDEPTASLDPRTSRQIMRLLTEVCRESRLPAIVNIHDVVLARQFTDRIIGLRAGRMVFDDRPDQLTQSVLTEIYGEEDWNAMRKGAAEQATTIGKLVASRMVAVCGAFSGKLMKAQIGLAQKGICQPGTGKIDRAKAQILDHTGGQRIRTLRQQHGAAPVQTFAELAVDILAQHLAFSCSGASAPRPSMADRRNQTAPSINRRWVRMTLADRMALSADRSAPTAITPLGVATRSRSKAAPLRKLSCTSPPETVAAAASAPVIGTARWA